MMMTRSTRRRRNLAKKGFPFKRQEPTPTTKSDPEATEETAETDLAEQLAGINIDDDAPVSTWEELGLKDDLMKGINSYGLEKLSTCQKSVIRPFLNGRDVICQAQSGMGKTAAFVLAVLQKIDPLSNKCQAIVLTPTRELANQAKKVFDQLGEHMNIKCVSCIGGSPFKRDVKRLGNTEGASIVIGTMGRLAHLFKEKLINGEDIKMFVMDEADKLLVDRAFREHLKKLFSNISGDAQVFLATATMPAYALDLAKKISRNPFVFQVENDQLTLAGIRQFYINVGSDDHKFDTLAELFALLKTARGMAFCNSRARAKKVSEEMMARGHVTPNMDGTMDQKSRNKKLEEFRDGTAPVLICSDLLGRGIDVQHVNLVINYDLPRAKEEYIHRVGRAGRYGRKGVAITFITDKEQKRLEQFEEFYSTQILTMPPNVGDLLEN